MSPPDAHAAAAILTAARTVVLQLQQPAQALLAAANYARRGSGRVVPDGAPSEGPHRDALLGAAHLLCADCSTSMSSTAPVPVMRSPQG